MKVYNDCEGDFRDSLVLAYKGLSAAIKDVYGEKFAVYDDLPDATAIKKTLPAANISFLSGDADRAFMREFEPHSVKPNGDGTFTVSTEILRFDYRIKVSFFASSKAAVQRISTRFYTVIEILDEVHLPDDPLGEKMQVFLEGPPSPPMGEAELYRSDQIWICRGKLLSDSIINAVDIRNFRVRASNWI